MPLVTNGEGEVIKGNETRNYVRESERVRERVRERVAESTVQLLEHHQSGSRVRDIAVNKESV